MTETSKQEEVARLKGEIHNLVIPLMVKNELAAALATVSRKLDEDRLRIGNKILDLRRTIEGLQQPASRQEAATPGPDGPARQEGSEDEPATPEPDRPEE